MNNEELKFQIVILHSLLRSLLDLINIDSLDVSKGAVKYFNSCSHFVNEFYKEKSNEEKN